MADNECKERAETIEIRKAAAAQSTNFNLRFRQRSKAETTRLQAFNSIFKKCPSINQVPIPEKIKRKGKHLSKTLKLLRTTFI